MPEFDVEVGTDDDDLVELCHMYWDIKDDGSFSYTVKALSERFGQPSHKISKIVAEVCVARSTSRRCVDCSEGFSYTSRASWTASSRYAVERCAECINRAQREAKEARDKENVSRHLEIANRHAVHDDSVSFRATDLDLRSAFFLAALLEDGEDVCQGATVPIYDRADQLTPTSEYDFKALETLIDRGLISIHPSSPLEAFTWKDDGSLGDSYYPSRASYYLVGSGTPESRVERFRKDLAEVISRESWPDHWGDQLSSFWFDVAAEECKSRLVYLLRQHGLDFTPGQKTDDVFRRALRWYSIGQVYYFIYRSAKDSAAYSARREVPKKQAANSAVTRIAAEVDRAYAQGWQVSVFHRDSKVPISTLSHILFTRALKLDNPMAYSPVDLPLRRAGFELAWGNIDSSAFERLIFRLVEETEGYENVEWLMHTNAPDHGRDVSAARLRRDPLSGHSSQRVAIQCKHYLSRAIRDVDVSAAIVSIDHWRDPPFDVLVMATSGRFTSDAVAWIERHNARGGHPRIEVWNDARLESLLSERPHLIRDFELR
ncbi:restriction endonuclease [Actinoplanes subglobosus]|uniref:Restriction endonuclease n=1 Tax=Actinoplanes subglobosus TaxID=1547892 RepID=A0ABV8J3K7_9ACTN